MTLEEVMANRNNLCVWDCRVPEPAKLTGRYTVTEGNEFFPPMTMIEIDGGFLGIKRWRNINLFSKIEVMPCGK